MWTQIKLNMVQGKYNIDAVMDLKIDKNMELREFRNLMQKLALQMWNRCVTVFKAQRSKAVAKKSQVFKLQTSELNEKLNQVSIFELDAVQNIFILSTIDILCNDEIHKKDGKNKKSGTQNVFAIKAQSPTFNRRTTSVSFSQSREEDRDLRNVPLKKMDGSIKAHEFLSYRRNEIQVVCKFKTLLELFQEQVASKTKELEEKYAKQEKQEKEFRLSNVANSELNSSMKDGSYEDKILKAPLLDKQAAPELLPSSL